MIKWWIAFAIAVPLSYALGVEMANSASCEDAETRTTCIINAVNLKNLKDLSCQIMYKILYDDLKNKYELHQKGLYRMPAAVTKQYEARIADFMKKCHPDDPEVERIERNEYPREVNMP